MRSYRTMTVILVAVGATVTSCSSSTTRADLYWSGYREGDKIASDYVKSIVDTEFS